MENNIPDSYLIASSSASQSPIEEIIQEKNSIIEEYKTHIEHLMFQYKEETIKHSNSVSFYKIQLDSLQKKCDAIKRGEIYDLLQYYEKEIEKINHQSKKHSDTLKNQITTLLTTIPDQTKLKKVIATLMNENSSLKESNETLWKLSRMSEAFKIVARKYESKIEEKERQFSQYERDHCLTVNSLTSDNKQLKDQVAEDTKTIKNLMNTIELLKSKGNRALSSKRCFSSNATPITSNNNTKRFLTEYEENKTEIELSNVKLDKCLNGSKMIISEKTEIIKSSLDKIMNKIMKDNSAYKAIIKRELGIIRNCFEMIYKESINLIKKANSSYNAYELSRNLLRELIYEYEAKTNNRGSLNSPHHFNYSKRNSNHNSSRSSKQIRLNKDINDTIFNSIELAKKYLNTFE